GQFGSKLDLFFDCDGLGDSKGNTESKSPAMANVAFVSNFDKYAIDENGVCKLIAEDIQLLGNSKGYNCSAISINDIEYVNFTIYPNPITETLIIQTDVAVERVEIYNALGQLVQSESNNKRVNVSQLSTGLYTVKVTTDAGVKVQKIVKK
ncbi:MAG: T9SS type A sorting domain-containing protein, partial [Bacteroidales bacterium]|nr:T9SS type A sorting domain-containing protein [Bacteroidales bacterium]